MSEHFVAVFETLIYPWLRRSSLSIARVRASDRVQI